MQKAKVQGAKIKTKAEEAQKYKENEGNDMIFD